MVVVCFNRYGEEGFLKIQDIYHPDMLTRIKKEILYIIVTDLE